MLVDGFDKKKKTGRRQNAAVDFEVADMGVFADGIPHHACTTPSQNYVPRLRAWCADHRESLFRWSTKYITAVGLDYYARSAQSAH